MRDQTTAASTLEIADKPQTPVSLEVESIDRRQRKIQAEIVLPHSPEQIWQVLTDYEGLADFIPNLAQSQRLDHPEGGIRVEQIGTQSALMMKFSARVVLDMQEEYPSALGFEMVEGDFKGFSGEWRLIPGPGAQTTLRYTLTVWPKRTMPISMVEKRLAVDLPHNLRAIGQRLETIYGDS
jgi:ribosome-associated toxin RatA of RatAB toxin-antitoxin module